MKHIGRDTLERMDVIATMHFNGTANDHHIKWYNENLEDIKEYATRLHNRWLFHKEIRK